MTNFDGPSMAGGATRGRRNTALVRRMNAAPTVAREAEVDPDDEGIAEAFLEPGEVSPHERPALSPRGIVHAMVTVPITFGDDPDAAWFKYGATDVVQEGETEAEAYSRVATVVNTRVIDLAEDYEERMTRRLEERRAALRTMPR